MRATWSATHLDGNGPSVIICNGVSFFAAAERLVRVRRFLAGSGCLTGLPRLPTTIHASGSCMGVMVSCGGGARILVGDWTIGSGFLFSTTISDSSSMAASRKFFLDRARERAREVTVVGIGPRSLRTQWLDRTHLR